MRAPIAALLLVITALCGFGCATTTGGDSGAVMGQRLLDKFLSPGFTGNVDIEESIPLYIRVTVKGANLRREDGAWKYDWIEYVRSGPFGTSARLALGNRPQ